MARIEGIQPKITIDGKEVYGLCSYSIDQIKERYDRYKNGLKDGQVKIILYGRFETDKHFKQAIHNAIVVAGIGRGRIF